VPKSMAGAMEGAANGNEASLRLLGLVALCDCGHSFTVTEGRPRAIIALNSQ
jgi:hypothetical protein